MNEELADAPTEVTLAGAVVAVAATLGSIVITLYALGAVRGWWQGSSCALAACGADDVAWAWYVVTAVGAGGSALMLVWVSQIVRADVRRRI